jgi:hypothetical protein
MDKLSLLYNNDQKHKIQEIIKIMNNDKETINKFIIEDIRKLYLEEEKYKLEEIINIKDANEAFNLLKKEINKKINKGQEEFDILNELDRLHNNY